MEIPEVSIIIVSWNTRDILRDCLHSVYDRTRHIAFEVILIDNASGDGSAEMVRIKFPQVILIENQQNRGFAAANNQGMKIAQGRYVLLLNPDTIILKEAIQKSVAFADSHVSAGVVGIKTFYSDGTLQPNCYQFPSISNLLISTIGLNKLLPKSRLWGRERYTWWNYDTIREVDVVAGCFMLVRREVLEKVGMMDESYFMYGEEMDWCWRIKRAGWKVMYYPHPGLIHHGSVATAKNPNNMMREGRKSYLHFIQKRQGKLRKYPVVFLLLCGGVARLIYWGLRWCTTLKKRRSYIQKKIRESYNRCIGN